MMTTKKFEELLKKFRDGKISREEILKARAQYEKAQEVAAETGRLLSKKGAWGLGGDR